MTHVDAASVSTGNAALKNAVFLHQLSQKPINLHDKQNCLHYSGSVFYLPQTPI